MKFAIKARCLGQISKLTLRSSFILGLALSLLLVTGPSAKASPVTWVTWTSVNLGNPGSASGMIGGIGVSYSGQSFNGGNVTWLPNGSWTGGIVGNGPSINSFIGLTGGSGTHTETVTFSSPVRDPVLAIWSLGQVGIPAEFLFNSNEPLTVEAGGASAQYGGGSLYTGGSCPTYAVCGAEGNGTIQFDGTFSSITWTNPLYEDWYAFDIGVPDPPNPTPEPPTLLLLGTGILGIAGVSRRIFNPAGPKPLKNDW